MKLIVVALICNIVRLGSAYKLPKDSTEYEETSFWMKSGQDNLKRVLQLRDNENKAKNIIIFIGDGMGLTSVTAGRIFKGQSKGGSGEEYQLVFEKFPSTGLSKTYNVDKQVPDSAGTATALFSGVKTRYAILGLDARAVRGQCDKNINQMSKLTTIADWAQESGKDTGFVTTTRVTHATPGALYAHINDRDWECENEVPQEYEGCVKDIARQLVEDAPGNKFKVIMGGGAQLLGAPVGPTDPDVCTRTDGVNLIEKWAQNNPQGKVVRNTEELMSVDIGKASSVLGIFSNNHLPYHSVRNVSPKGSPSLSNMTSQAIRLLRKQKNGFFLMVESGRIDHAHHENYAKQALREVSELEEAVKATLQLVDVEETLIIVTADHSHSFTINGYPKRGNDILGFANKENVLPYETLSYANGPGFYHHRRNDSNDVNETWIAVEEDSTRNEPFYRSFAGIYMEDETHGGEDVAVYAIGPYSHLFRSSFEQNYIAHVMAYAACLHNWPSHCEKSYNYYYSKGSAPSNTLLTFALYLIASSTILEWLRHI